MQGGDDGGAHDPFEGLRLDESFIAEAAISEASGEERIERLRRIDAEHRRLQVEDAAERKRAGRRRRRRWSWRSRLETLAAVGALGAAFAFVGIQQGAFDSDGGSNSYWSGDLGSPSVQQLNGLAEVPPTSEEQADEPLGTPRPVEPSDEPYAFLMLQEDGESPVAYDPCRPIHVVINDEEAPPEGEALLVEALEAVTDATGLQFVLDGPTDERASGDTLVVDRVPYQPELYPDRWAPVLVHWVLPDDHPRLLGDTAGYAGSQPIQTEDGLVYVTGTVTLDGPQLEELLGYPEGIAAVRSVLEHELGHLVGLDHVEDPSQLMNPTGGDAVTFAGGDRLGLSELGQGECFPEL